jgi:glucose/arabinose dehydrogenase
MRKQVKFLSQLLLVCCLTGCIDKSAADADQENGHELVIESEKQKFSIDTLSNQLTNPWGIAFLPDGRILVTEKSGEIRIFKDEQLQPEKIEGVPAVYTNGQGGLLDIKLHPEYATNGWIYLTYAKQIDDMGATTVARAKLDRNKLTNFTELFSAQPAVNSGAHFGSRVVFDGNGHIFVSSGERGTMQNAQNLGNHLGKILRLYEDGRVPEDNPFVNTANAKPEIWSYGHRNPQGLYYDKDSGRLWNVEHGPKGGDELNQVERGKNYGWPVITYGINYDGNPISDKTAQEGMEQPLTYWVPSIAPCGMTKITSDKFPNWKNNLMIGALSFQYVARVELDANGKYVSQEKLLDKIARVRMIAESPDGFIYVATESPGMLLKISPVK